MRVKTKQMNEWLKHTHTHSTQAHMQQMSLVHSIFGIKIEREIKSCNIIWCSRLRMYVHTKREREKISYAQTMKEWAYNHHRHIQQWSIKIDKHTSYLHCLVQMIERKRAHQLGRFCCKLLSENTTILAKGHDTCMCICPVTHKSIRFASHKRNIMPDSLASLCRASHTQSSICLWASTHAYSIHLITWSSLRCTSAHARCDLKYVGFIVCLNVRIHAYFCFQLARIHTLTHSLSDSDR